MKIDESQTGLKYTYTCKTTS